jgi:peptidoglycan/xylan/chitin deacetylase (PgdA/CDA1 family)
MSTHKFIILFSVFAGLLGMSLVQSGCASSLQNPTPSNSTGAATVTKTADPRTAVTRTIEVSDLKQTVVTSSPKKIIYNITSTPLLQKTQAPVPTPTPSPTWIPVAAKQTVTVPILMYHHISATAADTRYRVTVENFYEQMKFLQQNGYTALTTLELANILWDGGSLPPHPVVITFDDGNLDVYENAFPILSEFGFRAVIYIVMNTLEANGYVGVDQLKQLLAAGWEIGSHSMTHANLTDPPRGLNYEMYQSRIQLGKTLSTDILTFAYPYTAADGNIFRKVSAYGYRAAVCGGYSNLQSISNVYCLNRREVKGDMSMADFQQLLGLSAGMEP